MAIISILPFPEPGHFLPTIRIALSLQRRGHTVAYLSTPEFEDYFRSRGFRFQRILSQFAPSKEAPGALAEHTTGDDLMRRCVFHLCDKRLGRAGLLDLLLPDLLAAPSDLFFCDALVRKCFGSSLEAHLPQPVVLFSTSLPEEAESSLPEVVFCPRDFEIPNGAVCRSHRLYAEPSVLLEDPRCDFDWNRLQRNKSIVYCSLGTQASNYAKARCVLRAVIEAFAGLPKFQLVVAAGNFARELDPDQIPSNVVILRAAPQVQLLAKAALTIHHGGLGSIKESIMMRVPMIVVPFKVDQPANAKRVCFHRLGETCLPEQLTSQWLRDCIPSLAVSPEVRDNVAHMSHRFWDREREAPTESFLHQFVS